MTLMIRPRSNAKIIAILILVLLSIAPFVEAADTTDVVAIAQAVDAHYNHLSTLKADFVEIYSGAGAERSESGTLWLKKPGKMRWEYRSPREKLFVSDGKEAWFFVPGEQQVRRISARQLDDLRSPIAFLLGKSRLEKELKGLSLAADVSSLGLGGRMLRGLPVAMGDRVSQILLEINTEHEISRIVLEGTDGSTTEYRFTGEEGNVRVPEQEFHFIPPPGIEITEGDLPQ